MGQFTLISGKTKYDNNLSLQCSHCAIMVMARHDITVISLQFLVLRILRYEGTRFIMNNDTIKY